MTGPVARDASTRRLIGGALVVVLLVAGIWLAGVLRTKDSPSRSILPLADGSRSIFADPGRPGSMDAGEGLDPQTRMLAETAAEGLGLHVDVGELDACEAEALEVLSVAGGEVQETVHARGGTRVDLVGAGRSGWVFAWSPAAGIRGSAMDVLQGEVALRPAGESSIDGWISSESYGEAREVELVLVSAVSPIPEIDSASERALAEAIGDLRSRRVCVDGEWRLSVVGLPESWSGSLSLGERHCFVPVEQPGQWRFDANGRPNELFLERPLKGLRLRIERAPLLSGRVVWADDGSPVDGAKVALTATCAAGRGCPTVRATSDARGAFVVVVSPPNDAAPEPWWAGGWRDSLETVFIEVESPRGPLAYFSKGLQDLLPAGELGDFEVARGHDMSLRLIDGAGAPVGGGAAVVDRRSFSGADDGVVHLEGCTVGSRVCVGAPGFDSEVIELDDANIESTEPHDVRLSPSTQLTVEVRDALGRVHGGLRLSARGSWDFVRAPINWSAVRLHDVLSNTRCRGAGQVDDEGTKFDLQAREDGRFVLLGVRPLSLLEVVVRDSSGKVIAEDGVSAPQQGSSSLVRIDLPFVLGSLRGRVSGPEGEPVSAAVVRLFTGDGDYASQSDDSGRFHLQSIRMPIEAPALRVEADGYAPKLVQLARVESDETLPTLTLHPAHPLRVVVSDGQGDPVSAAIVTLEFGDGTEVFGSEVREGTYQFEQASVGPCVAVVRRGELVHRCLSSAVGSEIALEVPTLVEIEVRYTAGNPPSAPGTWLTLEAHSATGDLVALAPFEQQQGLMVCKVQLETGPHRLRPCLTRMGKDGALREPLTSAVEVLVEAQGNRIVVIE